MRTDVCPRVRDWRWGAKLAPRTDKREENAHIQMCRVQFGIAAAQGLGLEQAEELGGRGGGVVFCTFWCVFHGSGHRIYERTTESLLRMGSIQADAGNAGNQL